MSNQNTEKDMNDWRMDKLRKGAVNALVLASELLQDCEEENYLAPYERYHKAAELVKELASSINDAVEP